MKEGYEEYKYTEVKSKGLNTDDTYQSYTVSYRVDVWPLMSN